MLCSLPHDRYKSSEAATIAHYGSTIGLNPLWIKFWPRFYIMVLGIIFNFFKFSFGFYCPFSNVWCNKNRTKPFNSVLLLWLVRFLRHQTLFGIFSLFSNWNYFPVSICTSLSLFFSQSLSHQVSQVFDHNFTSWSLE